MENFKTYLRRALGAKIPIEQIGGEKLHKLPHFIKEAFRFYDAVLVNDRHFLLVEFKRNNNLTTTQIEKQLQVIKDAFHENAVFLTTELSAINRKRFIEKGINFIVPNKQMYMPDLLIDLQENFAPTRQQGKKLLPSAQYILLYKILKRNENIEQYPLNKLAQKLNYTAMGITKAVNNLVYHQLCTLEGSKEKYLRFNAPIHELWHQALPLLVNPVLKKVYVDEKPKNIFLFRSNVAALPEYTDIAEGNQQYYAIEKNMFYALQKNGQLINANEQEGKYCLEVWKYNPDKLAEGITEETNVDPLSLYLSLRGNHDERVDMALDKIIEKYIW